LEMERQEVQLLRSRIHKLDRRMQNLNQRARILPLRKIQKPLKRRGGLWAKVPKK
jgi:hypothetical protein